MVRELEAPNGDSTDWDVLYVARGSEEVVACRPIFTGDIFRNVSVLTPKGVEKTKTVLVLQHPCAMRPDGVKLARSLLVAEVRQHPLITPENWKGYGKLMPLPELFPEVATGKKHQAGFFDSTYHVDSDDLYPTNRVACLSLLGVNLLLQRWVYHSTRLVAPSFDIKEVTRPVFEEADLIEEWCNIATDHGGLLDDALNAVINWLGEEMDGQTRRRKLENEQLLPHMRRAARRAANNWVSKIN